MLPREFAELARRRLEREHGRVRKIAPYHIALSYPSPYRVGMSSLGMLQIYRLLMAEPGMACERFFLPDEAGKGLLKHPTLSYESQRPLGAFPLVAFSVSYELELAGVVQMLEAAQVPARRSERGPDDPLILAGGPLTFSNPMPLGAFVDVVVMGEADTLGLEVFRLIRDHHEAAGQGGKEALLAALAAVPHVYVPAIHGETLPPIAKCDDALLPAWSCMRTPDTELSDMFLIEVERGCSRGCSYCVMRRTTNDGMRIVSAQRVLELIPNDAKRVGLVGAAVSDHPEIIAIVQALVERGAQVGLSSLRPERLSDEFVSTLKEAGYRTLTTAMDGVSARVREVLDRRSREKHLLNAAQMARKHKIKRLKLYLMIGVPGERDEDVDEGAAFVSELSKIVPVSLSVAPFCAKRNTPLDGQPFAGMDVVAARMKRLRKGLRGRAEVRATSIRWAWVEHVLSQGGLPEAFALEQAVRAGGKFSDFKKAFEAREQKTSRRKLFVVRDAPRSGPRGARWFDAVEDIVEDGVAF